MPRRRAAHTQADYARAIRALAQDGHLAAVRFMPDGSVLVVPIDGPVKPYNETVAPQVAKRKTADL